MKLSFKISIGYFMDEWFFTTLARLGLTGARAQVPVGWKEICAVVERSLSIGIQMRLPCRFEPMHHSKTIT
jgi:hypothetical protein